MVVIGKTFVGNKTLVLILSVFFLSTILILNNKISFTNFLISQKSVEVLDCSDDSKDCETIVIRNTIKNCNVWYEYNPLESLYCENTTEDIDKVTLITDSANHVKSPLTDIKYAVDIMTYGLKQPWDIEFLPDGSALITQKKGSLVRYSDGKIALVANLTVFSNIATGLLGLAIDPDYNTNHYIYLFYTTSLDNQTKNCIKCVFNRISRFTFRDGISEEKILLDKLPGNLYHNGGRLNFGPDGKLYATTGDAYRSYLAQNLDFLGGKILRINADGSVPLDNPFENSYVYSRGHRNPQGLDWHPITHELFSTEHGEWRYDEINLIKKGGDYGWEVKQCDELAGRITPSKETLKTLEDPIKCFKDWTLAPGGAVFVDDEKHPWFGDMFVPGLRSRHLHRFVVKDEKIIYDEIFYINKNHTLSRRFRDVKFYNGSLWVLGESMGIIKISPRD